MTDRTLITDAWVSFRQTVVPRDVSAETLAAIQMAFYGGSYNVLAHVQGAVLTGLDAEAMADLLNGMAEETNEHFEWARRFSAAMRQQPAGRA
jgi:hypothetical protein